ncbi:MAG: sigma-70 family RNA polymerase sigma factor [Planctomycetota bacterium]|nr:MAG: sigma-70 family RNA polymerase sigma factor [Planctomycetota bacterium]
MTGQNEPDLVSKAIHGDRNAMEWLWKTHRRWVAVVLMAHKPRQSEMEDLLQEVAVKFVQSVSKLRDPLKFRPWLRSLAVHAATSALRRQETGKRLHGPWQEVDQEFPDPRPGNSAEQMTRAEEVIDRMARLPAEFREVLWLRSIQGLSQKAIAKTLQIPETTIETRLVRARKMLRQALEPLKPMEKAPNRP